MKIVKRKILTLVFSLALILFAACGGDDGSTDEGATTQQGASTGDGTAQQLPVFGHPGVTFGKACFGKLCP